MQELQAHYDCTSQGAWRKQVARANTYEVFYKTDNNFTFEKYVTKLKGVFNVSEKYGVPLYKEQMVKHILDQIMSPNTDLKT